VRLDVFVDGLLGSAYRGASWLIFLLLQHHHGAARCYCSLGTIVVLRQWAASDGNDG
jgi:hypothetical protein